MNNTPNPEALKPLLPCPFCKGESEFIETTSMFDRVECLDCGLKILVTGMDDAIKSWNTRTPSPTDIRLDAIREVIGWLEKQICECPECESNKMHGITKASLYFIKQKAGL